MITIRARGAALLLGLCCMGFAAPGTKRYTGDWFTISYPSSFVARKSLADSAFFSSNDGSVQFYVFSPQWNGKPSDVAVVRAREKVVARTRSEREGVVVVRTTVKALNGFYSRSIEDREDKRLNTRRVFAIRYRNAKVLAKWRKAYLAFKKSLVQYAD